MSTRRRLAQIALVPLLLGSVVPAAAQSSRPASWRVLVDAPGKDSAVTYSTMPPGWHVTTGPGALLFDPAWQLGTTGVVHAEIFLFPDSGPAEYGVFFVSSGDLRDAARHFTAVLLRRDGRVGIFRHTARGVDTVMAWTANAAIVGLDADAKDAVKNVMRVERSPAGASVSVNGATVATLPGGSVGASSGQAGLRVGEKMNLHVSKFEVRREM
jgi:hypothetical protein